MEGDIAVAKTESRYSLFKSFLSLCLYCKFYVQGDSGGPLTQGSTVYGVASWAASGCESDFPSVYTRVGAFKSWICAQAGSNINDCV